MKTLEQLNDEVKSLRAEINAREQVEYEKAVAKLSQRAIGACFVYRRNSYSCPEKPSDYWDVFRMVTAIRMEDSLAEVQYRECAIDSRGTAKLNTGSDFVYSRGASPLSLFSEGWKKCSVAEFSRNWKRVAARLGIREG